MAAYWCGSRVYRWENSCISECCEISLHGYCAPHYAYQESDHSPKPLPPYRIESRCQEHRSTSYIRSLFGTLVTETYNSIKSRYCLDELKLRLKSFSKAISCEVKKKIECAESHTEVLLAINQLWSWDKCEIFKELVLALGDQCNMLQLKRYDQQLADYLRDKEVDPIPVGYNHDDQPVSAPQYDSCSASQVSEAIVVQKSWFEGMPMRQTDPELENHPVDFSVDQMTCLYTFHNISDGPIKTEKTFRSAVWLCEDDFYTCKDKDCSMEEDKASAKKINDKLQSMNARLEWCPKARSQNQTEQGTASFSARNIPQDTMQL